MSYSEIRSKMVVVKKNHSCEWCAERINVGEPAFYRVYVHDGDFMHGRMHPECKDATNLVRTSDLEEGWMPGDFKRGSAEEK